jgi:hypothetical protein
LEKTTKNVIDEILISSHQVAAERRENCTKQAKIYLKKIADEELKKENVRKAKKSRKNASRRIRREHATARTTAQVPHHAQNRTSASKTTSSTTTSSAYSNLMSGSASNGSEIKKKNRDENEIENLMQMESDLLETSNDLPFEFREENGESQFEDDDNNEEIQLLISQKNQSPRQVTSPQPQTTTTTTTSSSTLRPAVLQSSASPLATTTQRVVDGNWKNSVLDLSGEMEVPNNVSPEEEEENEEDEEEEDDEIQVLSNSKTSAIEIIDLTQ